jgi:peptidoglycan/LPS O-acetylase OafA/YrhL
VNRPFKHIITRGNVIYAEPYRSIGLLFEPQKTGKVSVSLGRFNNEAHAGFRADIEGLRGIAVLLVVAFHVGIPDVSGGYVGVDMFFALSGFLITGLILREIEMTGRLDFLRFYGRRVRRLLPAFGLVLITTLLVGIFVFPAVDRISFAKAAKATSLYASNVLFMRRGLDYFGDDQSSNVFLHTWSLAVEEQFYLFWPGLIAWTLMRVNSKRSLAIALAVVSAASFVGSAILTPKHGTWAFFASPLRAWEFGLGGLVCLLPVAKRPQALGWIGLMVIAASGSLLTPAMQFPGFVALLPILGTIAVLIANEDGGLLKDWLGIKPLLWIGKRSYSWYLWHWPVLLTVKAIYPDASLLLKVTAALFALALADVTFRIVENPIRFYPPLMASARLSVSLAAFIPALGFGLAMWTERQAAGILERPEQRPLIRASTDLSAVYSLGCMGAWGESMPRSCVFGDTHSSRTVVLFGDSHAAHWFPAIETIADQQHWRLVTRLRASCPTPEVSPYISRLHGPEPECTEWRKRAMQDIAGLHPSAVVMSNSNTYVREPGVPWGVLSPDEWIMGLRSTLDFFDQREIPVALIADVPQFRTAPAKCLSRAAESRLTLEACFSPAQYFSNAPTRKLETSLVAQYRHALVADLTDQFCDHSTCRPILDSEVAYFDVEHLTATASRRLSATLAKRIDQLIRWVSVDRRSD